MRNQGKLGLGTLIAEYGLVAKTFQKEHEGKRTAGQVGHCRQLCVLFFPLFL